MTHCGVVQQCTHNTVMHSRVQHDGAIEHSIYTRMHPWIKTNRLK